MYTSEFQPRMCAVVHMSLGRLLLHRVGLLSNSDRLDVRERQGETLTLNDRPAMPWEERTVDCLCVQPLCPPLTVSWVPLVLCYGWCRCGPSCRPTSSWRSRASSR